MPGIAGLVSKAFASFAGIVVGCFALNVQILLNAKLHSNSYRHTALKKSGGGALAALALAPEPARINRWSKLDVRFQMVLMTPALHGRN